MWKLRERGVKCLKVLVTLSVAFSRQEYWSGVAMPSSRGSSQLRDRTQVSCIAVGCFTVQATREAQEYWSGEPIPYPGDLPDPGIELGSPPLQEDSLPMEDAIIAAQLEQWAG